MAIVADAARPQAETPQHSMDAFTQPTPRVMNHGFGINVSAAETHVTARGDVVPWAGIDNSADAGAPVVEYELSDYFHDSVPNTVRP